MTPDNGPNGLADWVTEQQTTASRYATELIGLCHDAVDVGQTILASRTTDEAIEIMREFRELRRAIDVATSGYRRAAHSMRAEMVRHMVDVEGLTMTEAGRRMDCSRQQATRLHQFHG
jgi:hypothetical protein